MRLTVLSLAAFLSVGPFVCAQPAAPADGLKPLKAAGRGTLKGRVSWEGPGPDLSDTEKQLRWALARIPPELFPKDGRLEQQVWHIGPRGGLADVMVFLVPPTGTYFPMDKDDLDPRKAGWRKEVVMEAAQLAYWPSHVILFPKGRDAGGNVVATGQVFRLRVSDIVPYHVKLNGDGSNPGLNYLVPPHQEVQAAIMPARVPVMVSDNIHPWMRGWVQAFDHPYAVITDRSGSFEIRNVPAGVKLQIQAWHATTGWLSPNGKLGDAVQVPVGKVCEHPFTARLVE